MAIGRPMQAALVSDHKLQRGSAVFDSIFHTILQRLCSCQACAASEATIAISRPIGLIAMAVGQWLKRCLEAGVGGRHAERSHRRLCLDQADTANIHRSA